MMTSHALANSVRRTKPVACGNQVYSTGILSSSATIWAILFSKPSAFSLENGMFAGSAQTRSTRRLTRSARCPSWALAANPLAVTSRPRTASATRLASKTGLFKLIQLLGLVVALGGTAASQRAVGAGLEINIDVVDVAHDVLVIAERRHDALAAAGFVHDAPAGDDTHEFAVAHAS